MGHSKINNFIKNNVEHSVAVIIFLERQVFCFYLEIKFTKFLSNRTNKVTYIFNNISSIIFQLANYISELELGLWENIYAHIDIRNIIIIIIKIINLKIILLKNKN